MQHANKRNNCVDCCMLWRTWWRCEGLDFEWRKSEPDRPKWKHRTAGLCFRVSTEGFWRRFETLPIHCTCIYVYVYSFIFVQVFKQTDRYLLENTLFTLCHYFKCAYIHLQFMGYSDGQYFFKIMVTYQQKVLENLRWEMSEMEMRE